MIRKAMLLAVLLAVPPASAQESWDRFLPKDTLGFLRFENGKDFVEAWKKTGLGKLVADPELSAFFGSIRSKGGDFERGLAEMGAFFKKVDTAFGGSLESGFASLGQVQIVVLEPIMEGSPPVFILAAELRKAELEEPLRKALREDVFRKPPEKTERVEGVEAERYEKDAWVAKVGSSLVLCSDKAGLAKLIRNQAKPPADALASSAKYAHARREVEVAGKSVFLYVDIEAVMKRVARHVPPDAMQFVALLGLQEIKYLAGAVEGDGDQLFQKVRLCMDISSAPVGSAKDLLDKSVAELAKIPGVVSVDASYLRAGGVFKDLFARLKPHFKMFSDELAKEEVQVDFGKFPVDAVARHLGEGQAVTIADAKGITMVGRSNAGFLASPASISAVAVVAAIAVPGLMQSQRAANERNASATLKTLASAEADFRSNDRDENRMMDFWVGDVSGLYRIKSGGSEIKLIEYSGAMADAQPLKEGKEAGGSTVGAALGEAPVPKAGYLYRAIPRYVDETGKEKAYSDGKNRNDSRFGFCAYPVEYPAAGRMTFILSEENTVWAKDTEGKPVEVLPGDFAKDGWRRLD